MIFEIRPTKEENNEKKDKFRPTKTKKTKR